MGRTGPEPCARGPAAHAWSTCHKAAATANSFHPSLPSSRIPRGPEPLCPLGDIQEPSPLVSISARPPSCRSLAVTRPEVRAKSLHPWRGQSTGPHNKAALPSESQLVLPEHSVRMSPTQAPLVPERSRPQSPNICNTQDHFPLCISMVAPSPSSPDEPSSGMILRPPQAMSQSATFSRCHKKQLLRRQVKPTVLSSRSERALWSAVSESHSASSARGFAYLKPF